MGNKGKASKRQLKLAKRRLKTINANVPLGTIDPVLSRHIQRLDKNYQKKLRQKQEQSTGHKKNFRT